MKQLDPKAVWLFFFGYLIGILFLAIAFTWIFGFALKDPLDVIKWRVDIPWIILFFIDYWLLVLALLTVIGYIWSHLSWRYYKYELREDGFRKEHGVIWKKYVTIPYERIQNVDIYRGLIARILGLSDLNIQTAGMSTTVGSYGGASEGRLPGLLPEVAEQLRDELVKRARGKHQGL